MLPQNPRKGLRATNRLPDADAGIRLSGVEKLYRTGRLQFRALRGIDLHISAGELVAIVGPSGSGKSTILNIMTGIDRPTSGSVTVAGEQIDQMTEEQLAAALRRDRRPRAVQLVPARRPRRQLQRKSENLG